MHAEQHLKVQTLLTYTPVELSVHAANKKATDGLLARIANEPVELRGQAPLIFALSLFNQLKNIAQEITYRPPRSDVAFVIFSIVEEEAFMRPFDVRFPCEWSEEELEDFENERRQDTTSEIVYDLDYTWQDNGFFEDTLKSFLKNLYIVAPQKQIVILKGVCPALPALMVFQWFSMGSQKIFYQENEAARKDLVFTRNHDKGANKT